MRYKIHRPPNFDISSLEDGDDECSKCKISIQLEYYGYAWVGLGISDANGGMVGNVAIIGMPGISEPRPYVLGGKELSYIEQLNDVAVEDGSIDYVDGRTVIDFTTSFEDWEPSSDGEDVASSPPRISLRGPTTFIWAHGKDGESRMGYHGPSQRSSRVIDDIMMPSGMMEGGG